MKLTSVLTIIVLCLAVGCQREPRTTTTDNTAPGTQQQDGTATEPGTTPERQPEQAPDQQVGRAPGGETAPID